jgi:hypothetical protein
MPRLLGAFAFVLLEPELDGDRRKMAFSDVELGGGEPPGRRGQLWLLRGVLFTDRPSSGGTLTSHDVSVSWAGCTGVSGGMPPVPGKR